MGGEDDVRVGNPYMASMMLGSQGLEELAAAERLRASGGARGALGRGGRGDVEKLSVRGAAAEVESEMG